MSEFVYYDFEDGQTTDLEYEKAYTQIGRLKDEVMDKITDAEKESGEYYKPLINIKDYDIYIENLAGSFRFVTMIDHYGYFADYLGADGDEADVFINVEAEEEELEDRPLFKVKQNNEDGSFDEYKYILGAKDATHAKEIYLRNYESNWNRLDSIKEVEYVEHG